MSWLRRSGDSPAAPATPPAASQPAGPPPEIVHSAPGLKQALERLPRPGASVLDLGPPLAQNVAFFNRLGARLEVFDLESTLRDERLWVAPAKLAHWRERAPAALGLGAAASFDLILVWDLPNYLGRERWPTLAERLVARLAKGGMLHLLARTGREMPERPSLFRWVEIDAIREEPRGDERVPAPRFSHGEIEKLHPGLAAAKSFLDKHGLQELLLEHADELKLPPRAVAELRKPRSHYPG